MEAAKRDYFLIAQEHTGGVINSEQNSSMSGFSANSAG